MSIDLIHIYELLRNRYGDLNWWPAKSPYEVIVGAVLTQNTNWSNVEKALANFDGDLSPTLVENMDETTLREKIRPAGFFNQKTDYLKTITDWYKKYSYDPETVKKQYQTRLRGELLSVKGIGRETADSILLYAFGFPEFVVDAYTMRLLARFGEPERKYEDLKAVFQSQLPKDAALYNNYHACIVINGKEHCRKKPVCGGCPLHGMCPYPKGTV
ncbi:MAG: endonuclease [Defluviitaleaceae bacterium]|nr:endonuclease [Defluviitaleaceae bacterium]MCL2835999.1 endonuclease [Defluviitaleaceae bacterium]